MHIGKEIRKAREAKRISQEDLAHLLQTTQKTVSNYESDKSAPNLEQLGVLARELDLNILELLSSNGIHLNQTTAKGQNNGIVHNHYPANLIESYEQRLAEHADHITTLKKTIYRLERALNEKSTG